MTDNQCKICRASNTADATASMVAMCISSYIMLLMIPYVMQSRRIALLVAPRCGSRT